MSLLSHHGSTKVFEKSWGSPVAEWSALKTGDQEVRGSNPAVFTIFSEAMSRFSTEITYSRIGSEE